MNLIKEKRTALGLSQKQLAMEMEVSQPTASAWENGVKFPSSEKLPKLAALLEVSIGDLIGNTDDPTPPAKRGQKKEALAGASDGELMFALFGEVSEDITEDDMKDVRRYAEFIAERKRKEREGK